ncbi:MAG: hypothetical protein ACI8PT_003706, partial [Gammaproteobacteria bacterium]
QLLDWFGNIDLGKTCLELICIVRFDGFETFGGIGQLNPEQMVTLFGRRQRVTKAQMDLASAGWSAFRWSSPHDLTNFMDLDLDLDLDLGATLERHLEEYPSQRSGPTRSEQQILQLVADGVHAPGRLFLENMELERTIFIGDWPTFSIIEALCNCTIPVLY